MKNFNIGFITTPIAAILTMAQTDQILQYIQIGLTIICAIVTIAFTIYKWYKSASADGKITQDEVDELINDLEPAVKELKDISDTEHKDKS